MSDILLQEDIRDKLLAIPIDVSVNINQGARRKRRQTPASQLAPVLDAKDVKPTRIEVCLQDTILYMKWEYVALIVFMICINMFPGGIFKRWMR